MRSILTDLGNRLNDIESSKYSKLKIYFGLLIFYVIVHISSILMLKNLSPAVFPLNSIYIANNLFFPDGRLLNHNLATTVISPSNLVLDYPPGIFLLSYILGGVKNIFMFLFVVQSFVPILLYKLYRRISTPSTALLATLVSSYYFITTNWWSPDFLIQPLMIAGILLLLSLRENHRDEIGYKPIYLGLITGIIIILKHNIGIFWAGLVVSFLLLHSIEFSDDKQHTKNRPLMFTLFTLFFAGGLLFLLKQIYVDAIIYYLLPYFTFWGLITYYVVKNKSIGLDSHDFLKVSFPFSTGAVIFPSVVFFWIGGAVGYSRYLSSFTMGIPYRTIWDHGIAGIMGTYVKFQSTLTLKSIMSNYNSVVFFLLFLLPFIINSFVVIRLFRLIRNKATKPTDVKGYLEVASMGIMGMLMFYPLEGYHILSTKLFIFIFMLLYFYMDYSVNFTKIFNLILIAMLIPIVFYSIYQPITISKMEISYGSEPVKNAIGLPMEKKLAEELSKQVAAVERSTQGSSYYVIDSTGATLMTLMTIQNNNYPQYYLEMRKGILNQEVTEAIIYSLQQTSFVLVNYDDYQKYLLGQQDDPFMAQILDFVHKNYVIVDRYVAPEEQFRSINHIRSFLIMEKSNGT